MTATMTTPTPEETREHLQARKPLLEARLQEKTVLRGDAHLALVRAIGIGPATDEEIVELRATYNALAAEVEEIAGALQHLDAEIATITPVVYQRHVETLVERAAELRADFSEAANKLQPMVQAFAREKYKPLVEEIRTKRLAAVQAEVAARQAQNLHREDVYRAEADVGFFTCGHPALDQGLSAVAFQGHNAPGHGVDVRSRGDDA